MNYDVVEARHAAGYAIWLRFRDDTADEIDLGPEFLHDNVRVTRPDTRYIRRS